MFTLKIDGGEKTEILGESFVWLRYDRLSADDLYIELCDLPTVDRDSILNFRNQIANLTEELAHHLLTLSSGKRLGCIF